MAIAVLGEALIDLIEGPDGAYRPHLGGSPFNVAIGLARQGVEVAYLSPLGRDAFGDQLSAALTAEGVLLPGVLRSLRPTSLALVNVDPNGLPSYTLYREGIADKDTSYEQVRAHLPPQLKLFHTGSLAITPSQLPKIRQLFEYLRNRGVLISVDINIRLGASVDTQTYLAGVLSLVEFCDIVKASDEDLLALRLGDDLQEVASKIFELMPGGILVLTEGQGGAQLFSKAGIVTRPSYPIAQVADTIGAGDTFHSAFLACLDRQNLLQASVPQMSISSLEQALDYACAAAAINVSRVGCTPPTYAEVRQFIAAARR